MNCNTCADNYDLKVRLFTIFNQLSCILHRRMGDHVSFESYPEVAISFWNRPGVN